MGSCTWLVLTNTHDPYALYRRSIGAQESALQRRTGLWGAVGNLSEDGDLWHLQKQPPFKTTATRGGCAPILTSSSVLPSGSARSHLVESTLDRDLRCSRSDAPSARRELGVSFSIAPVTWRAVSDGIVACATRQTHQEALALATGTLVQPSLSAPPSVGHCLSSRVASAYGRFHVFLTFRKPMMIWYQPPPSCALNFLYQLLSVAVFFRFRGYSPQLSPTAVYK